MNKIIKDGKVAVIYSPGFGAGWSTWADDSQRETLCMDERIVQPIIDGNPQGAVDAAKALFPDFYAGGSNHLRVRWLDVGTQFRIEGYDGNESLIVLNEQTFMTA